MVCIQPWVSINDEKVLSSEEAEKIQMKNKKVRELVTALAQIDHEIYILKGRRAELKEQIRKEQGYPEDRY